MICKCNIKMVLLEKVYNGMEDYVGNWCWCPSCGRVYYEDFEITGDDISHWKEPKSVVKSRVDDMKNKIIKLLTETDWCIGYEMDIETMKIVDEARSLAFKINLGKKYEK